MVFASVRRKRLGVQFLKILGVRLLESLPVVGPIASISVEMLWAAKEELERDNNRRFTLEELKQALRSLSYAEASRTADAALATRRRSTLKHDLTSKEIEELRSALTTVPGKIEDLLHTLDREDLKSLSG